jgi:hypothetical protein
VCLHRQAQRLIYKQLNIIKLSVIQNVTFISFINNNMNIINEKAQLFTKSDTMFLKLKCKS